jgi:O-antigen/teichoic acid export membrane protein
MRAAAVGARVRAQLRDPLLRSAYSLMANTVVSAVLGMAFWVAAARLYPPESLGRDAALIAALYELSIVAQFNLQHALARFLPSLKRGTSRALLGAYGLSGAAALVIGGAFVLLAPLASHQLDFLTDDPRMGGLYVLALVSWVWFTLQDTALAAVRRAPWVLVDNSVYGVLKLAALPVLVAVGAVHGALLAWVLPVVLLLLPINYLLFRRFIPEHVRTQRPAGSRLESLGRARLVRFIAQDYGATVLAHAGILALPLLVVGLLGSSANAYFYIPFTIVIVFDELFYAVGRSLVVEGALAEHEIRTLARKVVRRFVVFLVPGTLLIVIAAPLILIPFGEDYVRESTPVLRVLACGCVFQAAIALYLSIARLRGAGLRILAVDAALTMLLIGGTLVLADPLGLGGIALAWLGSSAAVALAILPALLRFFRSPGADEIGTDRTASSAPGIRARSG